MEWRATGLRGAVYIGLQGVSRYIDRAINPPWQNMMNDDCIRADGHRNITVHAGIFNSTLPRTPAVHRGNCQRFVEQAKTKLSYFENSLSTFRQWRSDGGAGGAGRTGRHLLGAAKGRKTPKIKQKFTWNGENSDCKFHMCLRARKTKRYGQRVPIVSYYVRLML